MKETKIKENIRLHSDILDREALSVLLAIAFYRHFEEMPSEETYSLILEELSVRSEEVITGTTGLNGFKFNYLRVVCQMEKLFKHTICLDASSMMDLLFAGIDPENTIEKITNKSPILFSSMVNDLLLHIEDILKESDSNENNA